MQSDLFKTSQRVLLEPRFQSSKYTWLGADTYLYEVDFFLQGCEWTQFKSEPPPLPTPPPNGLSILCQGRPILIRVGSLFVCDPELEFLNFSGAQELIPRNQFC
jgi:hypothetical protein